MRDQDRQILESLHRPPRPMLTATERSRYSVARALSATAAGAPQSASFEAEISAELEKQHRRASSSSILLPPDVFVRRDLQTTGDAGYTVGDQVLGFVELARPRSVLLTLGALAIEGLTASVTIPRLTAGLSGAWLDTESAGASEGTPTLGQIACSPKSVGGYTEVSRQLLLQSSPSVERFLRDELLAALATAIDAAGLAGSGADGEPLGIVNTVGIGSQSGTSLARTGLLAMQAAAGATLSELGGYVAPVATAQTLAGRETVADTGRYLWAGNLFRGTLAGYAAMSSDNVPAATLLFGGDWSTVAVLSWGDALEVEANPYANFPAGIVGLRVIAAIDVAVRQPGAFVAAPSVT